MRSVGRKSLWPTFSCSKTCFSNIIGDLHTQNYRSQVLKIGYEKLENIEIFPSWWCLILFLLLKVIITAWQLRWLCLPLLSFICRMTWYFLLLLNKHSMFYFTCDRDKGSMIANVLAMWDFLKLSSTSFKVFRKSCVNMLWTC